VLVDGTGEERRRAIMGRIIITTNTSLDGVVQDPDGKDGFARGGWFLESGGPDLAAWTVHETEETLRASALLLGRRSDEWFAPRWNSREGEWADALRALPKYVVSATADKAQWVNGTVLGGDVVKEISALKAKVDGEILVYASYQLVSTLIDNDLADELRVVVFPVVVGAGARLFRQTGDRKASRLVETRSIGEGLVYTAYEFVR
jgi:dihydrofolate reductase